MRLRLWRRRLTISAPRMAIRSAVPWPVRWLLGAVVLGLSGAVALWAFDVGRQVAGLDTQSVEEMAQLRDQVAHLERELQRAQAVANTAEASLITERTTQQALAAQLSDLQNDNRSLRRDLAFYEQLIPASGQDGLAVRGLQAQRRLATVHWQLLLVQSGRQTAELKAQLEVTYTGLQDGQPWSMTEPATRRPMAVRQSLRLEGAATVPADVVVKTVSIRVMQGATALLTQAVNVTAETASR